ncbi:lysophospholipid acyltransferase family protein [Gemmiger sp.]
MLLYWILLIPAWLVFHIFWRVEVVDRENLKAVQDGRAYIVAPNHISNLDPVFVLLAIFSWKRLRVLAKEELFKNPLAGWFLRCMGAVSIERGKGDTTTVEKLTNECKNGTGVLIFPEGTRTKTGKLGMIKSGAFVIAAAAGADMLPVRIIYNTKDGHARLFCKVRIVFGTPIPAEDLQIKDQSHKMAELRRMKNRLRDELEQLLADNAFAPQLAENPAPAVDLPAESTPAPDKPQLPEGDK